MNHVKRVIYISFYFNPDLSAGSFRNSTLALELAKQIHEKNGIVEVFTTFPHRYHTFAADALEYEEIGNLKIHRLRIPSHGNGMIGQIKSFWYFYKQVFSRNQNTSAELIFASSSRLFSAFLGYCLSKQIKSPLYLDIRDIFVDTMNDVIKFKGLRVLLLFVLKRIERVTFRHATHINLISGGFKEYFEAYPKPQYSFFSNGIDEDFLVPKNFRREESQNTAKKQVLYAGNIGEGQGLHKILPQVARALKEDYEFIVIGDGGARILLENEIKNGGIDNIKLFNPIPRKDLFKMYEQADFLFIHLNDYPAFRKVLPSKVFELATFEKPILAGVSGFAAAFIRAELTDSFVFDPCDATSLIHYLKSYCPHGPIDRTAFISTFKRKHINEQMATSILAYL